MTDTLKFAVIGNPISHSLSPQIHEHFASQFGLNISYEAIEAPIEGFIQTLHNLQSQGYSGVNVTVPFKLEANQQANIRDEYAALAEAANTLKFQADKSIHAHNTDGIGLVKDLSDTLKIDLKEKTVLILGAGGAVQGIIKPLLDAGVSSITISNRTYSKAQVLARKFSAYGEVFAIQQALMPYTPSFDLVINGTSASIAGEDLDIPTNLVTKRTICYDLMYSKNGNTPFVDWAIEQGVAAAYDGLGMLIEQAAFAFTLWLDRKPDTVHTKKFLVTVLNS